MSFYGDPITNQRHRSWRVLNHIILNSSNVVLVMGDFNEIISYTEKVRSSPRPTKQMIEFKATITSCGLHDVGFRGYKYTWRRGNSKSGGVEERLDRALASLAWMGHFPNSVLYHLLFLLSDHYPILLEFN